jgi:cyclopropane-fatty-acyl-phospholipid synthase
MPVVVRSPDALRQILTAPGELGLGWAYVAIDLDVESDTYAALARPDAKGGPIRAAPGATM